ncbi:MAG TPA: hypothetical protein VFX96_13795 [Pyrinomonadaceae bacterium]|nr:hypothetical protein [Pyrinomonadaceae bacterium]
MAERYLITDADTDTDSRVIVAGTSDPPLPEEVLQAISISNAKSVAEQPAMLANLMFGNSASNSNLSQQNAVSNQQSMNELNVVVTGKAVNLVANLSPMEAVSTTQLFTGNSVAEEIADLQASLDSLGG